MPNMPTQPNRPNMPIMPKSANSAHISLSVINAFLRKVHAGFDTMSSVEQGIWREILTQINSATVEGLMQSSVPSHSEAFLSALRHSNEVFAAFKVHALQQEVAAKLLTPDGHLKSFAEFRRDVEGITSHQCGAWLQTEYDTAVIRAHNAADWQGFEANKDIMPNLRWLPTTAPDPEVHHRSYWVARLNLPVDDPFWQHHHPGDHWNCKCTLEQNNDPVVRPPGITTKPNEPNMPIEPKVAAPQPGLDNNPGKDGHTFSQDHPYFPKACAACSFYKPGLKDRLHNVFKNRVKDCYNCPYMNGCLDKIKRSKIQPPKVEEYKVEHNGHVLISPHHGANEVDDNKRLAAFVADKLKTNVYLLPRLDPSNPTESQLRSTLLPSGVFNKKNPDFLINGKLFDGKCMYDLDRMANLKQQKNAIENHIKKAKKQADNIILEMPSFMDRRNAKNTIRNYLNRSKTKRVIMARYGNKLLIFKN